MCPCCGTQYGADVLSEQRADMAKMGSHTARYAAVNALWYQAGGNPTARSEAFRSFNWATYTCAPSGIVSVGVGTPPEFWFSDGYGALRRTRM